MNVDSMVEFCYLADSLSFTKTAEHFYTSRSVISRHVAALEETLDVKLLERDRHSVRLTKQGEAFYREAQVILHDYNNLLQNVQNVDTGNEIVAHVAYLANATRPFIVDFARYMKTNYPEIHVVLTCMEYGELCRSLEVGKVDVAFSMDVNKEFARDYVLSSIYSDQFYAIVSTEHALAGRTEGIRLADLAGEKIILRDSFAYSGLSDYIDAFVELRTDLIPYEYYRDKDTMRLKVQVDNCVAFESGYEYSIISNGMVALPLLDADTSYRVCAFYRSTLDERILTSCHTGFKHCRDMLNS